MPDLLAARYLMAISLGFHIIFASISMVLPFFMFASYRLYSKTQSPHYLTLTKLWLKGTAILFAVGAVSGTILSFELGLLWPQFMEHAGPIIGMPFSLEGAAFFIEAIAIGLFLYGWGKIPQRLHQFFGLLIGISGVLSGILVVSANGWMNTPTGFVFENGQFTQIKPVQALFNDAWLHQAIHMTLAAFIATGFCMLGIHSILYLKKRQPDLQKKAMKIILIPTCIATLLMPLSGDLSAKKAAKNQPAKFAAMEAHFHTESGADFMIGGIPNMKTQTVDYALKVPKLLSFLATGEFNGTVTGLDAYPKEERPNVNIVHFAFQIMIGIGMVLMGIALVSLGLLYRNQRVLFSKKWLWAFILSSPLGFITLEAGWVVTEVGRQPWIIQGIMKTKDAVTPVPHLSFYLAVFSTVYVVLGITVVWLMRRQFRQLS